MALRIISQVQGSKWALSQPAWYQKLWRWRGHIQHVRWNWHMPSLTGVLFGLLRLLIFVGSATAPFWIDYFDKTDVPHHRLALYSGAMFLLLVLNEGYNAFGTRRVRAKQLEDHRETTALERRNLFNELLNLADVPNPSFSDAAFMSVIRRTLAVILSQVKEDLNILDANYLEVSLLIFGAGKQVRVAERAVRNRAIGATIDRSKTMAYHVARSGLDWKHVPDLKRDSVFTPEGISNAACPYRSILLIPIIYSENQGNTSCGVVTIDSSRPFEFWNDAATDRLTKQIMPFVRLLAILCAKHPTRVKCVS